MAYVASARLEASRWHRIEANGAEKRIGRTTSDNGTSLMLVAFSRSSTAFTFDVAKKKAAPNGANKSDPSHGE